MRTSVVVASLVLLCACMHAAQADDKTNAEAWSRYWSAWKQQLGSAADHATFMQPPQIFDKDPAYQMNRMCDSVPAWQGTYVAGASSVYGAYKQMADQFEDNVSDSQKKQIKDLKDILDTKIALSTQCDSGKYLQYQKAVQNLPPDARPTWNDWKDGAQGKFICKAEGEDVSVAYDRYDRLLKSSLAGFQYVADARAAVANDAFKSMYAPPGGTPESLPACDLSPSYIQTLNNWQSGQLNKGEVTMSSKTDVSKEWTWSAGGNARVTVGWLSFGGSGGGGRSGVDTSSESFKFTLAWDALQSFTFTRGGWYDASIISGHINGPFNPDTAIGKGKTKLWGDGGILSLIPSNLVVVFNPSVTATLDQSTYHEVKKTWEAGGGVCFFGVCVGGHGAGSSKESKFTDDSYTFTLKDDSNIPKMVAITNQAFGASGTPVVNFMAAPARATARSTAVLGGGSVSVDATGVSTSAGSLRLDVTKHDVTVSGNGASFSGSIKVTGKC